MTIAIKDFYLMIPMDRHEYVWMKLDLFPKDIIEEYNLRDIVDSNGHIHCEAKQGMYLLDIAKTLVVGVITLVSYC